MEYYKCHKEMDREDGGATIKGIEVTVEVKYEMGVEDIKYNNLQLGKYSHGDGTCNVAICYECYIDRLFGVGKI